MCIKYAVFFLGNANFSTKLPNLMSIRIFIFASDVSKIILVLLQEFFPELLVPLISSSLVAFQKSSNCLTFIDSFFFCKADFFIRWWIVDYPKKLAVEKRHHFIKNCKKRSRRQTGYKSTPRNPAVLVRKKWLLLSMSTKKR